MADRPIPRIRPMVSQDDFNEFREYLERDFEDLGNRLTIIERALASNIEAVEQLTDVLFAEPEDDESVSDIRVDPVNPGNEVDLADVEDDAEAARREAEQLRAEAEWANEGGGE